MIDSDFIDSYGIEIIGADAYTERITTYTAFGKQRGNDFEGTKEECLQYLKDKNIVEVYGALKE